jgi:hypothetical protein
MSAVLHSRTRCVQRAFAIAIALLVALPDAVFAIETVGTSAPAKPMDRMSPQELERFVQQLNESANWRKYRRPSDPPDFVPGKPVKVTHGAGSSFGRGGMRGGGQSFRRGGLANRRNAKSGRGRNRDDSMAQGRGNSRSSRSGSGSSSGSRSSFGSSSRNSSNSSFGNTGSNSSFGE